MSGRAGGARSSGRRQNASRRPYVEDNGIRDKADTGQTNLPRKVVGQYMLSKTIGEGTFGKVKLAVHLPTGERVAVKILEKSRIKEQADVRRVNREIKILKKNKHENIIQLYEVLDTQNSIYLIMENCEGGEMFDYIVNCRRVEEIQACKFFHQIIYGVEILHNNEVTHRDLKPENLLLKQAPNGWLVKIVDFGLSNTHEGGKLLSTACGSPCYAAPEMIAGKKYVGPRADVWSLGVILFALVCGYLPFEDQNQTVLYRKILAGEYKPARWISDDVKDLIRRILETDPERRFTLRDIRKHRWFRMVTDDQVPREYNALIDKGGLERQVMNHLRDSGVDMKKIEDGLANKACNSSTAMYHLLIQKFTTAILKKREKEMTNIGSKQSTATNSSSNIPSIQASANQVPVVVGVGGYDKSKAIPQEAVAEVKEETVDLVAVLQKKKAEEAAMKRKQQEDERQKALQEMQVQNQKAMQKVHNEREAKLATEYAAAQQERMEAQQQRQQQRAAVTAAYENTVTALGGTVATPATAVMGANGVPSTQQQQNISPQQYQQTQIQLIQAQMAALQQQQQQQLALMQAQQVQQAQQQVPVTDHLPSLDMYSQAVGGAMFDIAGSVATPVSSNVNPTVAGAGKPVVPTLQLNGMSLGGPVVPTIDVLTSQTAREGNVNGGGEHSKQVQSARAALPQDLPALNFPNFNPDNNPDSNPVAFTGPPAGFEVPADILAAINGGKGSGDDDSRPSTRRSRLRSRDAGGSQDRPQSASGGMNVERGGSAADAPEVPLGMKIIPGNVVPAEQSYQDQSTAATIAAIASQNVPILSAHEGVVLHDQVGMTATVPFASPMKYNPNQQSSTMQQILQPGGSGGGNAMAGDANGNGNPLLLPSQGGVPPQGIKSSHRPGGRAGRNLVEPQ